MPGIPTLRWEVLGYKPNAWAVRHVHTRDERFGSYVTCRQCGKTWAAAIEIDEGMTRPADELYGPPVVGVLSYDYKRAELSVNRYLSAVRKAFGEDYIRVNMNKHEAYIPETGARLIWMSADDPDAGIGFTYSKLIVDEGQRVPDTVWEKIYPTLSVRKAPVRVFGTPDITPTQTWFRGLFLRGQDPDDPQYYSATVSWRENPWITREEVETARKMESEREFRMLYEGEWVDAEGAVFGNLEPAYIPQLQYDPRRKGLMSVDFGIKDDFTVVMIAEEATKRVFYTSRWSNTDPIVTYERIHDIWEAHGRPRCVADESGMGEAMVPELRERGIKVFGLKFTSANKMPIIGRLQAAIEHGRIHFPQWAPLITELQAYVYVDTPSGKLGAQAAFGFHDDCVMALALLNEGLRSRSGGEGDSYEYTSRPVSEITRMARSRRLYGR